MKNNQWRAILVLSILGMFCSGCIANNGNEETAAPTTTVAPTTVPPNVDTTPILSSELQTEWENVSMEYEWRGIEVQELLDTLQTMVQETEPDYETIASVFEQYDTEWIEYRTTLRGYYHLSILLEHTTPTADDLLALKKETLPFVRPDGDTYDMGLLNMVGESIMIKSNDIRSYIDDGIFGQDVHEELIEDLQWLEDYLPGYYDIEIGYVYYYLSSTLFRQSLYSDVLIRDCNPLCI